MKFKRFIGLILCAAAVLCQARFAVNAAEEFNVALNQRVDATSSYVPPEGFFDASFIVDGEWETYANGNVKLGWNTNPMDPIGEDTPTDVTITLDGDYIVSRIVLKPMKWGCGDAFPRDYELQVSSDGTGYSTVVTEKNKSAHADSDTSVKPIEYVIDPVRIRSFRIHITKQSSVIDRSGNYTSALGEVELYGKSGGSEEMPAYLNKTALNMNPGEKDWLYIVYGRGSNAAEMTFRSNNESVVSVDGDGTVSAVKEGKATVTVTDAKTGKEYGCEVTVGRFKASEHFQIVAFVPYFNASDINETTFDNLKKGGITNVEINFALASDAITYESNLKAIKLAAERGLDVTVSEKQFNGSGWQSMSDAKILEFVKRYSHLPGVSAYYVVDEPASSVAFARGISLIKSVMPNAVAHMNYCGAYADNVASLQNELKNKYGLSLDYVMYDAYVFMSPSCNENTLYGQLRYNHAISQKLGVPGATYIQAMNWNNNHRPNADEVRYQVFASLAGGVKQISYFCWKTPAANAAETYGPAVIDINNKPTDLFEPVSRINAQVQALGPTLMKLEMNKIYHTGTNFGAEYTPLPLGFFIQPTDDKQPLTVSHMIENENGRNYAMIVNRDYKAAASVSFTADKDIKSLEYISTENGQPAALKASNGVYTVNLAPGEGVLLRTNADYKFVMKDIVDFRQLEKAVKAAEAIDLSLYKETGKQEFSKALADAKKVLNDSGAKQSAVDSARTKLVTAQNKLRPYAQDGVNLAQNKKVTAKNSYEDGTYFSASYITDGVNLPMSETTHAGWSVDPYSRIGRNDPVDVTVDLEDVYSLNTVKIMPCVYNDGGLMPSDFEVLISEDGKDWKKVASVKDNKPGGADLTFTLDNFNGRYVRVHITKHNETPDVGTGGCLSQFGELEVYGKEVGAQTDPGVQTETDTQSEAVTQPEPVTETETEPGTVTEPDDTTAEQTADTETGDDTSETSVAGTDAQTAAESADTTGAGEKNAETTTGGSSSPGEKRSPVKAIMIAAAAAAVIGAAAVIMILVKKRKK